MTTVKEPPVKTVEEEQKVEPINPWGLLDAPFFYETNKVGVWLEFLTSIKTIGMEMSGLDGTNVMLLARGPGGCCAILKTTFRDISDDDREVLIDKIENYPKNNGNPAAMRKRKSEALYHYLNWNNK